MRFAAVSMPVNPPDQSPRLTKAQLYQGLVLKARDPVPFVSIMSACKVLSEHPTGLLREVYFKDRTEPVHEKVAYYPPGQVTFTMTSPKSGEQIAHITNVISTTPEDELLLTVTFAYGPNGPLDVDGDAELREKEQERVGVETITRTLSLVRDLVKSQEIR